MRLHTGTGSAHGVTQHFPGAAAARLPAVLGVSGARRNASAAVCVGGELRAACEQERITRVRDAGLDDGRLPAATVDHVLSVAGCERDDIAAVAVAESQISLPKHCRGVSIDHHLAHAATAFLTSGLTEATVLVCDRAAGRELSVWRGRDGVVSDYHWPWQGRAFATLHALSAEVFGFAGRSPEHQLEALARLGRRDGSDPLARLLCYRDGGLHLADEWRVRLHRLVDDERRRGQRAVADLAASVQHSIGRLIVELCRDLRAAIGSPALCLGGGLFFNTFYTTLLRNAGIYDEVFVPINPGNAGLSTGAAMLVSVKGDRTAPPARLSPFLGPEYGVEEVKATLDSCKLSYEFLSESDALDTAVKALAQGRIVGWFQGRMEWGHKALGNRSILANATSPYVLDSLNGFLRKRDCWRPFGLSVRQDDVKRTFCGPASSPHMEFEYTVCDDRLRPVTPDGVTSVRVQTVARGDNPLFWELHRRLHEESGSGVLVNTSLNGFNEPIACSPRDAVRVFFGTGVDVMVMGRFVLSK